jgi:hypothetical protein
MCIDENEKGNDPDVMNPVSLFDSKEIKSSRPILVLGAAPEK